MTDNLTDNMAGDGSPSPLAAPAAWPAVRFLPSRHKRVTAGNPWAYSNEIAMDRVTKAIAPGTPVRLLRHDGLPLAIGYFNPHTLIAARVLTSWGAGGPSDGAGDPDLLDNLVETRLRAALALRERLFPRPFYRWVHAEGDFLPGLVVDRYADVVVIQPNTAGMDRLVPVIAAAVEGLVAPDAILVKAASPSRRLEGLEDRLDWVKGAPRSSVAVEENGLVYAADLAGGQKTGWFFDHRDNRAFAARFAPGARVLDLYTYLGGFALAAAAAGAERVVAIDSSAPALVLAAESARRLGLDRRVECRGDDVFAALERLAASGEAFDLVLADPPAFAKSKKDHGAALRGYRKLARLAARVTAPGGVLMLASCSHAVTAEEFAAAAIAGLEDAGRAARILRTSGAGADHPVHPHLPETAYLKAAFLALD